MRKAAFPREPSPLGAPPAERQAFRTSVKATRRLAALRSSVRNLRSTLLASCAALLLTGGCTSEAPSPQAALRWQDHAVLTWAEKLSDQDPWVRVSAADALGRLGPDAKDASGLLLNRLREDPSPEVRARCARALGEVGAREAKDALLEVLRGGEQERVRSAAAAAIVALGASDELLALSLDALDALDALEALEGGPTPTGLQAIANSFAALGSPGVEPLRTRLSQVAPTGKRSAVALCLGAIGEAGRPATPELVLLLEEPDDRLRLAAIIALGAIGGSEACRALAETVATDPEPSLQLEALIAGAGPCDFEAVEDAAAGPWDE